MREVAGSAVFQASCVRLRSCDCSGWRRRRQGGSLDPSGRARLADGHEGRGVLELVLRREEVEVTVMMECWFHVWQDVLEDQGRGAPEGDPGPGGVPPDLEVVGLDSEGKVLGVVLSFDPLVYGCIPMEVVAGDLVLCSVVGMKVDLVPLGRVFRRDELPAATSLVRSKQLGVEAEGPAVDL